MKEPPAIPENREVLRRSRTRTRLVFALALGFWLLASSPLLADPTQEEVFRSIGRNVSEPVDTGRLVGVLAAIAGAIALLFVVGQRRSRTPAGPKALHSHGKLLKEVLRSVPLKPAELKQLKLLAELMRGAADGEAIKSPLTLVLCPSALARAAKIRSDKINPKIVGGLVRKLTPRGERAR